jgi:exopolysaccharide biosynthesis protein
MLPKIFLSILFISVFLSDNLNAKPIENLRYIDSLSGRKLIIIKDDEWRNIDEGVDFKSIKLKRNDSGLDIIIKLLRIDLKLIKARVLYSKNSGTNFQGVKDIVEKGDAIAAINGSFFDVNGNPLGLLIADGRVINNRVATHSIYSGIFYVKDDKPYIVKRGDFQSDGVAQAIQVGPILIADGKDIEGFKDIHSVHYRSGIAIDNSGRAIIYATDTNYKGVSLHEVRQIMRLPDISCISVLNLDGGGSTQMYISTPSFSDYIEGNTDIPVAIGFYRR